MGRLRRTTRPVSLVLAFLVVGGGLAPIVRAQTVPDRSEVVLVLDFSASILEDGNNRRRFGAALERIADRVDQTSSDLVVGDATVTIVQFATRAADYRNCADLKLAGSPETVARFADCLRSVARAYRTGPDPALTRGIGIDTNYVAAMEQAAKHLPADAVRPAMILFTDGKHDVAGVPVAQVSRAMDRLFGDRTPFALLPVGMGLDPAAREGLTTGLERLRIVRDMPPCVSGSTFDWPVVVFESADEAGTAVAVALQNATCTFTVAPSAPPTPAPPPPEPVVQDIQLTALEGRIELAWTPPAPMPPDLVDYRARCRAGDGDWIESTEGVSLESAATVEGLIDGVEYTCEVAAVAATSEGVWTAAPGTATPTGRPAAPGKPAVTAHDGAVEIRAESAAGARVSGYRYECSSDNGTTWDADVEVSSDQASTARVRDLTNGVEYVCRAFAINANGSSDASPASDAVRPCRAWLDCNPLVGPALAVLVLVLAGGILLSLIALYRGRTAGYVVAVVDIIHTVNLGSGRSLGIELERAPRSRTVIGIHGKRGPTADFRIRKLGGDRFEVTDKVGRHVMASGESIVAIDSKGVRHALVLHAFATGTAATVATPGR